jgi:hypothetical protein
MTSLYKKQITTLNNLTDYIEQHPLTPKLNDSLSSNNIVAVMNFLKTMTIEDFKEIQADKKLKITNPLLKKFLSANLIEDKNKYLQEHILYTRNIDFDQLINQKNVDSYYWQNRDNISVCIKSEKLIERFFQHPSHFINNYLDNYENGRMMEFDEYFFSKNAFSEQFNTMFVDYMKNYDLYLQHPRVGKDKLDKIAKEIIALEKPLCNSTALLHFDNYSLEVVSKKQTH